MTIETKKLVISEELKRKVEMICKFAYVEYSFTNGYIINLKNTNIAYVKPHILKVKDNDYLIFENSENVLTFFLPVPVRFTNSNTLLIWFLSTIPL